MKRLLFLSCPLLLLHCLFDATPPSPEELNQIRPLLLVEAFSLIPGQKVGIRLYEKNTVFSYPFSYGLTVDFSGRFVATFSFQAPGTGHLLFWVDANPNQTIDSSDRGFLSPALELAEKQSLIISSLVNLIPLQPTGIWSANTQIFCFFAPTGFTAFDINRDSFTDEILLKTNKKLAEMGPVLWFRTDNTGNPIAVQNTALPPGEYQPTCLEDQNFNQNFEASEALFSIPPITVLAPGPIGVSP